MPTLLTVEASPRVNQSISRELASRFGQAWETSHHGDFVVERDFNTTDLPFVTVPWITGIRTLLDKQTEEIKQALAWSNLLVDESLAADKFIISTPVYNYNVPGNPKVYIDHIVRRGRTLGRTEKVL